MYIDFILNSFLISYASWLDFAAIYILVKMHMLHVGLNQSCRNSHDTLSSIPICGSTAEPCMKEFRRYVDVDEVIKKIQELTRNIAQASSPWQGRLHVPGGWAWCFQRWQNTFATFKMFNETHVPYMTNVQILTILFLSITFVGDPHGTLCINCYKYLIFLATWARH